MPRQNRVNPFGQIFATPARGTLMGNRGCLHDADGQIRTHSARPAWVTCLLEYHGRKRQIMAPGQYTELFFLDEATALAAGHRPCGTCQKARYNIFKTLWMQANPDAATSIQDLDRHLQKERLASAGKAALSQARLGKLPPGGFVLLETELKSPLLCWEGRLHPWTAGGYLAPKRVDENKRVVVLTPRSICRTLEAGYSPYIHPSVHTPLDTPKTPEWSPTKKPPPATQSTATPARSTNRTHQVAKLQHPAPSSTGQLHP